MGAKRPNMGGGVRRCSYSVCDMVLLNYNLNEGGGRTRATGSRQRTPHLFGITIGNYWALVSCTPASITLVTNSALLPLNLRLFERGKSFSSPTNMPSNGPRTATSPSCSASVTLISLAFRHGEYGHNTLIGSNMQCGQLHGRFAIIAFQIRGKDVGTSVATEHTS